jgi:hypothetical protein
LRASRWLLLLLTLPTANASARMRYWRALKAQGCAALRDGAYLLPQSAAHEAALAELAVGIVEGGGTAQILLTVSRDAAQDALFRSLFDRSAEYDEFLRALMAARKRLPALAPPAIERLQQRLQREVDALRAADHFPNAASARAAAAWTDFAALARAQFAPDEPQAGSGRIARLERRDYQKRTWATRRNLWVDRVASAWLIRRFIDAAPTFLWLKKPADCPRKALGFDFDGAAFTHVGEHVSFEVLMLSFGLEKDRGLARLGQLVRSLDVGGGEVAEAPGFEALMAAARQRGLDDDRLLAAMSPVLDSFYEFYAAASAKGKNR